MIKVIQVHIFKWGFWIRIFGKGVWFGKDNGLPPLFSERYGHRKVFRFYGLKYMGLN